MELIDYRCKNCGADIENAKFCEYCGTKREEGEVPSQVQDIAASNVVLVVDDVFKITGKGNVVIGKLEKPVSVGDILSLTDADGNHIQNVTIKGIEAFRKIHDSAEAGENVGLLLDFEGKLKGEGLTLRK